MILCFLVMDIYEADAQSKRRRLPAVEIINHEQLIEVVKKDSARLTLVNIWASWDERCIKMIPALIKLKNKFNRQGLKLILISIDDTSSILKVRRMLGRLSVNFMTYLNGDTTIESFIVGMSPERNGAIPTSFLYDNECKLLDMIIGERTFKELDEIVRKRLEK